MKTRVLYLFSILFIPWQFMFAQKAELNVFVWNVENLFYPEDDSLTDDDEFTPYGERFWAWNRYNSRLTRIWKTLMAAGDPRPPEIICFSEIENRKVLEDLLQHSPLKKYDYRIVHRDSPDRRGIDVAIAFRGDRIIHMNTKWLNVDYEMFGGRPGREILLAEFLCGEDSFLICHNHWPSKYGGEGRSSVLRMKAAQTLAEELQQRVHHSGDRKVLVVGDFNDVLEADCIHYIQNETGFLRQNPDQDSLSGSYKYQGKWQHIDHVFYSPALARSTKGIVPHSCRLFSPRFLFEKDELYGGEKPFRSWQGYRYREGFSDHIPILVNLSF